MKKDPIQITVVLREWECGCQADYPFDIDDLYLSRAPHRCRKHGERAAHDRVVYGIMYEQETDVGWGGD